jgi:hypothetical protein
MPLPELRVPTDVLRREAGLAVDASSLRAVAGEMGMSAMGLRSFIQGGRTPQDRTLRKVTLWHAGRAAARQAEGEEAARSVLTVLAGLYPQADRPRVLGNFLGQMEREFRASRMAPPPWLATLADELR